MTCFGCLNFFGSSFVPHFFGFWFDSIPRRCSPRAPRLIRSSIAPLDTRKAKHPTCKSRAHSADRRDVSTGELNVQTCNDFPCTSFQPIRTILEEDRWSENSSFFSEVGSYSTDSTNLESTSTDDNFDQIFGDAGIFWNRSSRNSTDSDTASSSSFPSPLHSRHSPIADFDCSSSRNSETCCPFPESTVDHHDFWAGDGRGSLSCRKQCRNLVDSSSSSCRERGSNRLGRNYDNAKCSCASCSRRSTRERVDWTFCYKIYGRDGNNEWERRMSGSLYVWNTLALAPVIEYRFATWPINL